VIWESYSEGMSMLFGERLIVRKRALHNKGADTFSVLMLLILLFELYD